MNNITGSPISTVLGILMAGLVGVQQYVATGGKITWQLGLLVFAIAAIGMAKNDNSFNMGAIDRMVLSHVQGQLQNELNKEELQSKVIQTQTVGK
jgi:hypothetical protein